MVYLTEVYEHDIFGVLRTTVADNNLWFAYNDFVDSHETSKSEINKIYKIVLSHNDKRTLEVVRDGITSPERFISENAIYKVMMRLDTENAIKYQDWICDICARMEILNKNAKFFELPIQAELSLKYICKEINDNPDSCSDYMKGNVDRIVKSVFDNGMIPRYKDREYREGTNSDDLWNNRVVILGDIPEEYSYAKDIYELIDAMYENEHDEEDEMEYIDEDE